MLVTVLEPEVRVEVEGGALRCMREGELLRVLHPHQVQALHLHGSATLTGAARRVLLQQGTDVVFMTRDARFLGRLVGATRARGDLRLTQLRSVLDPARRLALARDIVVGKLENQRRLLLARRLGADDDAIGGLDVALEAARRAGTLDQVRGAEGAGARAYFGAFPRLIRRDDLTFDGRSRQPPRDLVNAMLSYGYTLLVTRVEHAIRIVGLDPHVGLLHDAGRGAPSLALDLAEAWRPMVDSVVLSLVNRRQVGPDDARHPHEDEVGRDCPDAVWMNRSAKTILLRAWEARLRGQQRHPVTGERWTPLSLFLEQATQIGVSFGAEHPRYPSVKLGSIP